MAYAVVDLIYGEIFHYNDTIFKVHHLLVILILPIGLTHKIGSC